LVFHDLLESFLASSLLPSHYKTQFPAYFVQTSVFFMVRTLSLWMTICRLHLGFFVVSPGVLANTCGNIYIAILFAAIIAFKYVEGRRGERGGREGRGGRMEGISLELFFFKFPDFSVLETELIFCSGGGRLKRG
jgi:hypothetical protein